jgi:tetratricopeptide (TPR) repeat protein
MLLDSLRLLFQLYYRPTAAMSGLIDEGRWLFGLAAVVLVALTFQFAAARDAYRVHQEVVPFERPGAGGGEEDPDPSPEPSPGRAAGRAAAAALAASPFSLFRTVLGLALLYVPGTILVAAMLERIGSFGVALRRDYVPLLTCASTAWAAAYLPAALVVAIATPSALGPAGVSLFLLAGTLYFAFLMVCAVRTVFGMGVGKSVVTVSVSWVSLLLSGFLYILASPFFLILLFFLLRGQFGDIGSSFRQRQSFRRSLEAATVNPRDAGAHYQLGLIYQQRRQYSEAIARFKQAVEIDPREVDAHFQLGRIAREQGRLQEAIDHFNAVVVEDDRHAQSEVWREIGATYADAGMYDEAREALERYVERRPYDPEGLYYLGDTYAKRGDDARAREMFERCVEAARTTHDYRRSQAGRWRALAEDRLREQGSGVGGHGSGSGQ